MDIVEQPGQLHEQAAALKTLEAQLAGVLRIADDAIISVDNEQRIQMFNQGAERLFGYSTAEVLQQPLNLLLPPRYRTVHRQHIGMFAHSPEVARTMGERREIWALRKNGEEFPAEASIAKLATDTGPMFTVILRDITERKRLADALEQRVVQRTSQLNALLHFSEELFGARGLDAVLEHALAQARQLVPGAHQGAIYLVEGSGTTLTLRAQAGFAQLPPRTLPSGSGLLGLALHTHQAQIVETPSDLQRLIAREPNHGDGGAADFAELSTGAAAFPLLAHAKPIGVLVLLRTTGTGPFVATETAALQGLAKLTAAAVQEEQQARAAASLSTRLADLEAQQQSMTARLNKAEAGMLQAARLAAVGQLAASIAHEINNPLYAARNALFLLEDDLPPEGQASPYLSLASEQLTRIAHIIERMRDFYRPTRGELGPCDLNRLLEDTLQLASLNLRHEQVQISFIPAPELPPVLGSADQLRQVFLNLVLNSIEAMEAGGTLTVCTTQGPSVALVEIEDTGIGIPEEIRTRLFEPFFTTKTNGTGLGLAISAHIVTQHGGQIEVDSIPQQGTTFRIALPYQPNP